MSIYACSETDEVRTITTNEPDMTSIPEIDSQEWSNSDLRDMQAADSNLVTDLKELDNLYEKLMPGTTLMSSAGASPALHRISSMIEATKESLCDCRNTKPLLQCLDMVNIVCLFLTSEQTGNWKLHLQVLQENGALSM